MQSIPAFLHCSTIAWIDDDELFLETASHLFPSVKLKTFIHPDDCLNFFRAYLPPSHALLRGKLDDDTYDTINHSPVDLNVTLLKNISSNENRNDEISVIIVDYKLPKMNGLELCKKLELCPAKKILLTGEANHDEAISAFNNNTIDRFIRKDSPLIVNELQSYVRELQLQYFSEKTYGLVSHLEAEQQLPITDPYFNNFFQQLCNNKNIQEYYLINKNGSYLLIDHNNQKHYLIIHTDKTLDYFIDQNDDLYESIDILNSIKGREKIPFFGVDNESWQFEKNEWPQYLYVANTLSGRENYYWSLIKAF